MLLSRSSGGNGPKLSPHRIYLVGAPSTGNTTLARWIRDNYEIPMIADASATVASMAAARGKNATCMPEASRAGNTDPTAADHTRADLHLADRQLSSLFWRQVEAEHTICSSFVSDRGFSSLADVAHRSTAVGRIFRDPRLADYMRWVQSGLVFFLRPQRSLWQRSVQERSARVNAHKDETTWDDVVRADGMIKLLLEQFEVPYIPVASLSMQQRVRLTERCLDLAGMTREQAGSDATSADAASSLRSSKLGRGNMRNTASPDLARQNPARQNDPSRQSRAIRQNNLAANGLLRPRLDRAAASS
ncbi:MAG: AAA family ATPase [Planctomycetota bacterium]